MRVVGFFLVIVLAGVYAAAIRTILRAPFRGLAILVAGMAFHNFLLMVLLRLSTPHIVVRIAQAWKEGILALLFLLALREGSKRWRQGWRPRLTFLDWLMLAFSLLALLYALLPGRLFPAPTSLAQRLLALRTDLLLPALYAYGRIFWPGRREDLAWSLWTMAGSAAAVGLLGVIELWLIPTRWWLDAGVNQYNAWLGFTYHGLQGLPENFFQGTAQGLYLRREVSTYISPLGVAYTGLLLLPPAAAFAASRTQTPRRRALLILLLALLMLGVLFSVTRLAIALMVAGLILLTLLLRRPWLLGASAFAVVGAFAILYLYPRVGPLVDANLNPSSHPSQVRLVSSSDPSLQEHAGQLGFDLEFVILHPMGAGLGSAVHRFGVSQGPGESAIFDVFGELGALGGLLYLPAYLLILLAGVRAFLRTRSDLLRAALPLAACLGGLLLLPITLTSDAWGDLPLTFLFWWAGGYSVRALGEE
jgi:hypothetical protein